MIEKDLKIAVGEFAAEIMNHKSKPENQIKEFKLKTNYNKELQKLKDEIKILEAHHVKEISALRNQLSEQKVKLNALSKENEDFAEQIRLHKSQLEEKYVTTTRVWHSKESIKRSLVQVLNDAASLRSENDSLKFKLSSGCTTEQELIENGKQLKKFLLRQRNISSEDSDETACPTLDEAMPIECSINQQKQEEKTILEKELVEKIKNLEDLVLKIQNELKTAIHEKDSYEKQIIDMRKTIDQLTAESHNQQVVSQDQSAEQKTEIYHTRLIETEKILACFQEENKHLKVKIIDLQQRLINAESKREVISEGYGEGDITEFSELQDRVRHVLTYGSDDVRDLIQIIDDLCKQGDKRDEDLKKEVQDLQHQFDAAVKQLHSSNLKFQEEQEIERENERTEAAEIIKQLQDQLQDQRDRSLRLRDETEFVNEQATELETQNKGLDIKLKEAVIEIKELKNNIQSLENEISERTKSEATLNNQIHQLKEAIVIQDKNQQDLEQELEIVKSGNESVHLSDQIGYLEDELRKHQFNSEHSTVDSSALRHLCKEIRELQVTMDCKTRELESLHVCGSNLSISQPSEDVSIGDQIDEIRCSTPDNPSSLPVMPLDCMSKLQETIMKHFRTEDVALKRMKDLEIQISSLRRENEELLAEQELLQQKTSEQLFQIESLRARLEEHKHNIPFILRQATSRLEAQLHETNEKLVVAERAIVDKEIELNEVNEQLERVIRLLADREMKLANVVHSESDIMKKLKDRLQDLEEENKLMQANIYIHNENQNLPKMIVAMLTDKNTEIAHLKKLLGHRSHEFLLKQSARTLSDVLSIDSECEDACKADSESREDSTTSEDSHNLVRPRARKNKKILVRNANTVQRIRELELQLHTAKEELRVKCETLEQREVELTEIQTSVVQLQQDIESLNEDRLLYKDEYKSKIQRDLVEVENALKDKTEEVEENKKRLERTEAVLKEKLEKVVHLKQIISEKDIIIDKLKTRNIENENELKKLKYLKQNFEFAEFRIQIQLLSDGMNIKDRLIRLLEVIARNSLSSKELKDKVKLIRQAHTSLRCALEIMQTQMKNSANVEELNRKLKEGQLDIQMSKAHTQLEMLTHNDVTKSSKKHGDIRQSDKAIEVLTRLNDNLDVRMEMLKSQKTQTSKSKLNVISVKKRLFARRWRMKLKREKLKAKQSKAKDTELITMLRIKLSQTLEARDQLFDKHSRLKSEVKYTTENIQKAFEKILPEKIHLQTQLDAAKAEIEELANNLKAANRSKDQLKADLRKAKEDLKARIKECNQQKSVIKSASSDSENSKDQQRNTDSLKLKKLKKEFKKALKLVNDLETEMKTLKFQLSETTQRENEQKHKIACVRNEKAKILKEE